MERSISFESLLSPAGANLTAFTSVSAGAGCVVLPRETTLVVSNLNLIFSETNPSLHLTL